MNARVNAKSEYRGLLSIVSDKSTRWIPSESDVSMSHGYEPRRFLPIDKLQNMPPGSVHDIEGVCTSISPCILQDAHGTMAALQTSHPFQVVLSLNTLK